MIAGDVFMKYTESNTVINAELMMPRSSYDPETYFEFTIEGKNTHSKDLYYEILINHGEDHETRKTRLDDKFLRFRLEEIVGDNVTPVIEEGTYEEISNTKIWVNTIASNTKTKTSIKYKLYMWITDEVKIGAVADADYSQEVWNNNVYASIKVSVNGDFEEKDVKGNFKGFAKTFYDKAKKIEVTDACNPISFDDDGTLYLSGSNDCINFNYVWYSGKLWRIVAINPDSTIKLVTQDIITTISRGADTPYENSWMFQWLNEDFKDTLYNYENIIVQNARWNATAISSSSAAIKPLDKTIITMDIGLLNAYEYAKAGSATSYLNIGYYWWLLTQQYSPLNWYVINEVGIFQGASTHTYGVRPSINLKSEIKITDGDGSKTNPYRINGDKEPGNSGELINTRISGEYVKVDNKIYRIVGIENKTTKLTSNDYLRDEGNKVLEKFITEGWKDDVTSGFDSRWAYYLNKKWLTENLKQYITNGTYYLKYLNVGSYKNAICEEDNTTKSIRECVKTTDSWTGSVGFLRYGEMFAAQLGEGYLTSSMICLITPRYSTDDLWVIDTRGSTTTYNLMAARPTIYLKSEVIITGGDGMSEATPYTIDLPKEG